MKSRRLATCLFLFALLTNASLAQESDNSVRILLAQSDQKTAKVTIDSKTYLVPIDIETGLSWDDVKDGYYLPPEYALLMKQGRLKIFITCSGASFQVIRSPREIEAEFNQNTPSAESTCPRESSRCGTCSR